MARILVTGMSGVGKSSLLVELSRRGHRVVDTDYDGYSEWLGGEQLREHAALEVETSVPVAQVADSVLDHILHRTWPHRPNKTCTPDL